MVCIVFYSFCCAFLAYFKNSFFAAPQQPFATTVLPPEVCSTAAQLEELFNSHSSSPRLYIRLHSER